ncbi:hypothetical protein [Saccharicrinis carchari]|nr:hypothetical protein [Saccharicrinis carchari]
METNQQIDKAIQIIGYIEINDYILDIKAHAAKYKHTAPEFSCILNNSAVQSAARMYNQKDRDAIDYQNKYKKLTSYANKSVFMLLCLTVILTTSGAISKFLPTDAYYAGKIEDIYIGLITLGIVAATTYAFMCFKRIKTEKLIERWMETRATAETERINYFETIINHKPVNTTPNPTFLQLLKFEYFRRYQLSLENRQWLKDIKKGAKALEKLEQQLKQGGYLHQTNS